MIKTGNWYILWLIRIIGSGGKKVLIRVGHIGKVGWSKSEVFVDLSVSEVENCNLFDDTEYSQVNSA